MEIDRIRILKDNLSIWLVYAGRSRSLLDEFITQNAVFLSIPGFAATSAVFGTDELIAKHLAMSDQIAQWNFGSLASPPSRQPNSYSARPYKAGSSQAKGFSAEIGNIRRLYREVKAGDIVLSPRRGQLDPPLIGEVRGDWQPGEELAIPTLSNEIVPVRKVRWLNTALARRDFAPRIARRLQNQHAITRLDDRFYKDIVDLVYPSYIWQDNSKLDIFGEDYRGTDPSQIHATADLIKFVVASVFAYERGEISQFLSMPTKNAVAAYYDQNLIEHFGQNFNSPGAFSVISRRKTLAGLAAVGIIIATAGVTGNLPAQITHAVDSVSNAMDGPGKAAHVQHVGNYVHSMTSVDWKKVQADQGEPARQSLTISLSAKQQIANHRDQLNAR